MIIFRLYRYSWFIGHVALLAPHLVKPHITHKFFFQLFRQDGLLSRTDPSPFVFSSHPFFKGETHMLYARKRLTALFAAATLVLLVGVLFVPMAFAATPAPVYMGEASDAQAPTYQGLVMEGLSF